MDDVALVAAVQRGDEAALAYLFEECHGWVYSTCLNALRDTDAAAEATGRVFEIAIRTRLAGATALRPAMIRLVYDACIEVEHELLRRRWRRRRGEQPPAAPDPHDLRLVAWRAAGDLTGPDRILFALAAGEDFTSESIAKAVAPDRPASVNARLDAIREHVVADVVAARSLDDCPDLRDTLRYAAKEPDHTARRRIHAHLTGSRKVPACARCTATKDRWPLAALAALLPLTALPPNANDRLLDRMEAALRARLAAGTDRVRAVGAGAGSVIDGTMTGPNKILGTAETGEHPVVAPRPAHAAAPNGPPAPEYTARRPAPSGGQVPTPNPAAPNPAAPEPVAPEPAAQDPAARNPAAQSPQPPAPPTRKEPTQNGAANNEAAGNGSARSEPAQPAAGRHAAGRGRKLAATAVAVSASVLTLATISVIALGSEGNPKPSEHRLTSDSTEPPDVVAAPTGTPGLPPPTRTSPSAHSSSMPRTEVAAVRADSPSPSATPTPRVAVQGVKPTKAANPFATFGTLTVASPIAGSTIGLDDVDARIANVTLSVDQPAGFDAAALDSTLAWSGTYKLRKEIQDVDLGHGQSVTVDLQAAPRCDTEWTITATLTPPTGAPQTATTTTVIATC